MHSIKQKLIALFALVLMLGLGGMATVLMLDERARVTADITESVVHFAELSAEQIARLYDLYYLSQSYAIFDAELAQMLLRAPMVARVQVVTATGDILFDSAVSPEELSSDARVDEATAARLTVNRLSVARGAMVAFVSRDATVPHTPGRYLAADVGGVSTPGSFIVGAIDSVIYPLSDDRRRVILYPDYAEVTERTWAAIRSLAMLFAVAFGASLLLSGWFAGTITAPLLQLRDGALRIAKGDLSTQIAVRSHDETRLLADTFNQMTRELSSALDSKIAFERTQKEFEVARDIQEGILPKQVALPGLDVAVVFRPATEVGGDVYDVLTTAADKHLLYLGDVTGHGVPAGMVAALTSAVMSAVARTVHDPAEIIRRANDVLFSKTKSNMFVTLLALEWDARHGTLSYVNAGHEPFFIAHPDGTITRSELGTVGLGMLGAMQPAPALRRCQLAAGDTLMLMTDGILEAEYAPGKRLGTPGVQKILQTAVREQRDAAGVAAAIATAFDARMAGSAADDDITFFIIQKKTGL